MAHSTATSLKVNSNESEPAIPLDRLVEPSSIDDPIDPFAASLRMLEALLPAYNSALERILARLSAARTAATAEIKGSR